MSDAPIAARPKGAARSVQEISGIAGMTHMPPTMQDVAAVLKPPPDPFEVMQNVADELKTVDRATRRRIIETLLSVM